jgi:hypothetical protein
MVLSLNSFILLFTTLDLSHPGLWRHITKINCLLSGFERGRLIISSITSLIIRINPKNQKRNIILSLKTINGYILGLLVCLNLQFIEMKEK